MKLIILRHNASDFFQKASEIELANPNGEWRYFKFKSETEVLGLYENSNEGLEIHPEFFKYFLGQFSPEINSELSVKQSQNFEEFCLNLNSLLKGNKKILDLSCSSYWIWSKAQDSKILQVSKKLQGFLSFKP